MAEHIKFFEENEIANLVRNNIFLTLRIQILTVRQSNKLLLWRV